MFKCNPVAIIDRDILDVAVDVLHNIFQNDVNLVPWPEVPRQKIAYETQREKMLTSFVLTAPFVVDTPYWLKVDADAIASQHEQWVDPDWFKSNPAWVASGWGYTKAKGGGGSIVDWCQRLEIFGDSHWPDKPRLGMLDHIEGNKCKMSRMASWVSWYNTEWTKEVANLVEGERLPVPSQDTFHWYCAARGGYHTHCAKMKRRGWANSPSIAKVRELCEESLRCQAG